ncbi:hypothetical protein J2I47_26315 [Fibrella sp. HMF5335]|uniref:Uncharacterized protein n=1 Tax=Fibrella rubiginis TaxID=2817060 RepID=A0A939GNJ4_9BACT|nr:hypothetical protein [Fibrella rubiginis]MBO0940086.1 hypothetical protein [Fibrella rubiginis]
MINDELVQVMTLTSYEDRQAKLSIIISKYKNEDPFTTASAGAIISSFQTQGMSRVDAINSCMSLCEEIATIDKSQGLYLMIQLYTQTINDYVHHVWDAVEIYLFENPSPSVVNYLNYLTSITDDLSLQKLYQNWATGITQELTDIG